MWLLSTWCAKIIKSVISILGKGDGTTLPGHLLLKLFPSLPYQMHFNKGIILISGTNGKTTTSKITAQLLEALGLKVTHNKSGSNLMRGLLSAALLNTDFFGKPKGDIGVFEVDEFSFSEALQFLSPTVVVLLNLSRDQLDRYGETDIIFEKWLSSVEKLSDNSTIICDGSQAEFQRIPEIFAGSIKFFDASPELSDKSNLHGEFNAKNLNAASLILESLGYSRERLLPHISKLSVAYGRGEVISSNGKNYHLFLAKNPASFNNNLDMIEKEYPEIGTFIFALNDNIPDGRDVSWIYDIDSEKLKNVCRQKNVWVTGSRALDLAVRLKYAGVPVVEGNVSSDLKKALFSAPLSMASSDILVLPNYSAMLQIREILTGKKIL